MISKATLKKYEFYSIENYFDYILESDNNGNSQQVKDLFKKLNNEQKRLFFAYIQPYENNLKGKFDLRGLY